MCIRDRANSCYFLLYLSSNWKVVRIRGGSWVCSKFSMSEAHLLEINMWSIWLVSSVYFPLWTSFLRNHVLKTLKLLNVSYSATLWPVLFVKMCIRDRLGTEIQRHIVYMWHLLAVWVATVADLVCVSPFDNNRRFEETSFYCRSLVCPESAGGDWSCLLYTSRCV